MFRLVLLFTLLFGTMVMCKRRQLDKESSASAGDLGGELITSLRNDVNIDLSADEEYEDLRAELLAYHTALASITPTRRSMRSTPCWLKGGICIEYHMCEGHRFLTQVNGCRRNREVCCFVWNKFQVRDHRDKGLKNYALPWNHQQYEIGGKGVIDRPSIEKKKSKNKKKRAAQKKNYDSSLMASIRDEIPKEEDTIADIPVMVIIRNNDD